MIHDQITITKFEVTDHSSQMKYAEEAVLFACIRQERLMQVMGSLRTDFSHIIEAEYLSRLLYSLAPYTDMWHLR